MTSSRRSGPRRIHRRLLAERLEPRLLLATFVVHNTLDSGLGSLRQAIMNSNATPGASNTISFDITPRGRHYTINLLTALPAITYPVSSTAHRNGIYTADRSSRSTEAT